MKKQKDPDIRNNLNQVSQRKWMRVVLLTVLAYEAAGAISGGFLLALSPDGSLMNMNVEIMNGFFNDFLVPGCMLVGLGIVTTMAFIKVLLKHPNGWIFSGLSLGGLFIWFTVEIIILREFHWLHAMWGLPVLLGGGMMIPLVPSCHKS